MVTLGRNKYDQYCRLCFTSLRGTSHMLRKKNTTEYRICKTCYIFNHEHHQQQERGGDGDEFINVYCVESGFNQPPKTTVIRLGWSADLWYGHNDTITPIDHIEVWLTSGCPQHHWNRFVTWIANHTALTSIHINVEMAERQTNSIKAVVAGLQASTSLQSVCLELHLDEFITKSAGKAIQELILDSGSIQHLAIRLSRVDSMIALPTISTRWFEDLLFGGRQLLTKTRLSTFAYYGTWKTSPSTFDETNGIMACNAMTTNPHLRQIKIPNSCRYFDNKLAMLAADKRNGWKGRWTCPKQVQFGNVLEEALCFPCLITTTKTKDNNNNNNNNTDKKKSNNRADTEKVSLLFHFLQERPDLLLMTTEVLVDCLEGIQLQRKRSRRRSSNDKRTKSSRRRSSSNSRRRRSAPSSTFCSTTNVVDDNQWHHCWACQTHILGEAALKDHLIKNNNKKHHHNNQNRKSMIGRQIRLCKQRQQKDNNNNNKPARTSIMIENTNTTRQQKATHHYNSLYCWCCQKGIQGEAAMQDHCLTSHHSIYRH